VRNIKALGRYYKMPMAGGVRIVIAVMPMVMRVAMTMVDVMMGVITALAMIPMRFICTRAAGLCGFDMDVRNVVSRVAVPQAGSKPRFGSRI
jgi:hypothetical protein